MKRLLGPEASRKEQNPRGVHVEPVHDAQRSELLFKNLLGGGRLPHARHRGEPRRLVDHDDVVIEIKHRKGLKILLGRDGRHGRGGEAFDETLVEPLCGGPRRVEGPVEPDFVRGRRPAPPFGKPDDPRVPRDPPPGGGFVSCRNERHDGARERIRHRHAPARLSGLELSPALHFGQIGVGLEHRLEKVPHRKPHAASVDERALGHLVPRHPGPERRRPEGRPVAAFAARTAQGPAHGLEGMLGMHARLILEDKHARTSREARRNGGEARPGDEFGRRRCAERGGRISCMAQAFIDCGRNVGILRNPRRTAENETC